MSAAAPFKSEFLRTLEARGYIHQITHPDELDNAAVGGRRHGLHRLRRHAPRACTSAT
jgi:hypothetical protein